MNTRTTGSRHGVAMGTQGCNGRNKVKGILEAAVWTTTPSVVRRHFSLLHTQVFGSTGMQCYPGTPRVYWFSFCIDRGGLNMKQNRIKFIYLGTRRRYHLFLG